MARVVSDVLRIMRLAISRRNTNDPDSTDTVLLSYLNDFVSLTMTSNVRLFENWGTVTFNIDETVTDGVYTWNDLGITQEYDTIIEDAFISLADPPDNSLSWNTLKVYLNPGQFYQYWGVENTDVLTTGMPTEMLFYGNQLVFRTIPNDEYIVTLYGYKKNSDYSTVGDPAIQYDYWLRYLAYGAALNYARDYRYTEENISSLERSFRSERRLLLTRTHDQIKTQRGLPSF